ncbi:Transcription factor hy5 [Podila horticola]|nr:Transcription factor hy5 [Podila horticola]
MFSTTLSPVLMPDMMAHASSADAPFDSEVSFADLDSEALVTTLSATPLPTFMTSTPTQTITTTITPVTPNCDPSIIAISPLNLKLESPLLTALSEPEEPSSAGRRKSTSTGPSSKKRPAADPLDKEAKARERVLRNRAAAQESRDKKRKYVTEIEASNESLQQENVQLLKRLKTVESDNLTLSHKLEALSAQFAQMQQQLSLGMMNLNNSGVGFCQSAVLAKKAKASKDVSTNSRQQKLAPPNKRSPFNSPHKNNHRRQHSMTMKNLMVKAKSLNREAPDQSAARWTETSCRPFCNNSNKALTLSSFAAASFQLNQLAQVLLLASILPQLMLNFSTLFLISIGAQSSNLPTEDPLLRQAVSFIHRLSPPSSPLFNCPTTTAYPQSGTIKDSITSLNPAVIEEIVTEFRQGRKDAARRLLVKALLFKS